MKKNFLKTKEIIKKSDLPLAEQEELLLLFSRIDDRDLEPMVDLFSDDISWVRRIADNYAAKQGALISDNPAAWQNIINIEKTQIESAE